VKIDGKERIISRIQEFLGPDERTSRQTTECPGGKGLQESDFGITRGRKLKCHLFLKNNVHEMLDLILNLISDAIKKQENRLYIYVYRVFHDLLTLLQEVIS
jgi:hypothetical protein